MERVFRDSLLVAFEGNAGEMSAIPNESIDVILTDPPYGVYSRILAPIIGDDECISLMFEFAPEAFRVLKPGGALICLHAKETISLVKSAFEGVGFITRDIGGWHKTNPPPQMRKVKWQSALELWILASKPGKIFCHWEGMPLRHNVIEAPIAGGNERKWYGHSRQKPELLMVPFFEYYVPDGGTVLDPFCGAGTVSAVATKRGVRSISIDIDRKWVDVTVRRHLDILEGKRCGIEFDPSILKRGKGEQR